MKGAMLLRVGLLGLTLLAPASRLGAQYEHPDLKNGRRRVQQALIVPAVVRVEKEDGVSIGGVFAQTTSTVVPDESARTAQAVERILAAVMAEHGCRASPLIAGSPAQAENLELARAAFAIVAGYRAMLPQLEKNPKRVRKGQHSLGPIVQLLKGGERADALVLVLGTGFYSTAKRFFSGALSHDTRPTEAFRLSVVVADAQTGDVLYFAQVNSQGHVAKEPEKLREPLAKAFRNFSKRK